MRDCYIICSHRDPIELVKLVNEMIKRNYWPLGGLSVTASLELGVVFCQAMLLQDEKD